MPILVFLKGLSMSAVPLTPINNKPTPSSVAVMAVCRLLYVFIDFAVPPFVNDVRQQKSSITVRQSFVQPNIDIRNRRHMCFG